MAKYTAVDLSLMIWVASCKSQFFDIFNITLSAVQFAFWWMLVTREGFLGMTALGKPSTSKDFLHCLELQKKREINKAPIRNVIQKAKKTLALNHIRGLCIQEREQRNPLLLLRRFLSFQGNLVSSTLEQCCWPEHLIFLCSDFSVLLPVNNP